jgi:CubicO group peptidase (beta-lactamase class C family)
MMHETAPVAHHFHRFRTTLRIAGITSVLFASAQALRVQQLPSDSAIRSILKTRVDSARAVGIVVGILENGQRRYISYGSAGSARPLDDHTIFEIGSVSKTFTSLLLADAVVRGEARLDEPVADLLPSGTVVPSHDGQAITLEQLATHRSGLPRMPTNFAPADLSDPYASYDAAHLIAFLSTYKLPRAPGDSAEYSNLGAALLGYALVSHASAPPWGALLQQRITTPLGMRETFTDVPESDRARFAVGHDNTMDSVPHWHIGVMAGAGAVRSTAADMLTYLAAEMDTTRGPLARAIALGRKPRADFGGGNRIALAWLIGGTADHPLWWHNGETGGFASFAAFDPARKVAIVVLSNAGVLVDDIGTHVMIPAAPLRMPGIPQHRTVVALSPQQMVRVVGEYPLSPKAVLTVTREGDAVYGQITGQPKIRLWPTAQDSYFLKEVDVQLDFKLEWTGDERDVATE